MSYIFSRELVEEYSAGSYSDTDASVPSKLNPTLKLFFWRDKQIEPSRLSRFGMTCEHLTGDSGAALLTSFVADFLVRISALPEKAQDLTVSEAVYGATSPASLAKYDHDSHSLKTAQHSLIEDLTGCCVILPRSGLMRSGQCWEREIVALRTSEIEYGYWPTPTRDSARKSSDPQVGLADQVVALERKRMFPTATAYKGWSQNHNRANSNDRLDYTVEREGFTPGQQTPPMRLNPDWVEWLMGWPIGQTALKPLGTGRFQEWQQQHSFY